MDSFEQIIDDADDVPLQCRMMAAERSKSYAAFCMYLCQYPSRDMNKVAQAMGVRTEQVYQWSSEYSWKARSAAYDEWLSVKLLKAHAKKEVEEMLDRHANIARGYLNITSRLMTEFFDRVQSNPQILKTLKAKELFALIGQMAKIIPQMQEAEAVARGLTPSKRVEITGANGGAVGVRFMPPVIVDTNQANNNAAPQIDSSNNGA